MQKILLIQLRQLGDILLTTPCIREVRQAYPNAQLDFLTHSMGKLILKDNPYLTNLITYSEKNSLGEQVRLIRRLRATKYDAVVDFMYNPRSAIFAFASQAPQRIAFPSRRSWAYNLIVPQKPKSDYIVREKFELLKPLKVQAKSEELTLPWFSKDMEPFLTFSKEFLSDSSRTRVILSPTHRREARQWPKEQYAELADELVLNHQADLIWFWGPGEEDFVKGIQKLCVQKTLMAPPTTFAEMAAFMANCDLFIGNSNGPSHVAVSAGIPSLQLHGPTIAVTWCPNTELHRSIQKATMEDISVGEIILKLSEMSAIIRNNITQRVQNGDRMSWNQTGVS